MPDIMDTVTGLMKSATDNGAGRLAPAVDRFRPRNLGELDFANRLKSKRVGRVTRKKQREELTAQIEKFEKVLVAFLDFQLRSCHDLKEERKFTEKWELNNLRAKAKVKPAVDDQGKPDKTSPDSLATLKISQGWSFQGVTTAAASVFRLMFNSSSRPFKIRTKGNRKENQKVEMILRDVLDDLLARGRYVAEAGRRFTQLCPQYGTTVIRYEPSLEKQFIKDPATGEYREEKARYRPRFNAWPLQHVYHTDYDKPYATDQKGVYWISPTMTLRDLESEEATFELVINESDLDEIITLSDAGQLDEETFGKITNALMVTSGKYVNLNSLRDDEKDRVGAEGRGNVSPGYNDETQPSGAISPFRQFPFAEYEGPLPMSGWVKDKIFTPELAEYFGIRTSFKPKKNDEDDLIEWGLLLNRIPVWRCAYTNPNTFISSSSANSNGEKRIVMVSDSPYRRPRKSDYKFSWLEYSNEFLGSSITEIGHPLEDAADALLNAEIWTSIKNAHPSWVGDSRGLAGGTDSIEKLLTRLDGWVEVKKTGIKISDIVQPFFLPVDDRSQSRRAELKGEFESSTAVSAAAKGTDAASGTGTLGEIRINESKSNLIMINIILGMAQEQNRLFKDLIVDAPHFMGHVGFYEYCREVSGERAVGIEKMLTPTDLDTLGDQFEIDHPIIGGNDFAVVVTTLERLFQLVGPEHIDPKEFTSLIMELVGVPHAEDLLPESASPLEPSEEHKLIAQGVMIKPNPREDFATHMSEHMALLQQISQGQPVEDMGQQETQQLIDFLPMHIQNTQQMAAVVQVLQQQVEGNQARTQAQSQNAQGMDRMETDTVPQGGSNAEGVMNRQAGGNLQ